MTRFDGTGGLNKATLADQVYDQLRGRILAGRLRGGARLMPDEIAAELSVSPTPVKEALLRLEADGLVDAHLRRGAYVRRFDLRTVEELCEARIMIEPPSLLRAFFSGGVTNELVASLETTVALHERHASGSSLDDLQMALLYDREFHHLIVAAAGNDTVTAWHAKLLCQTHTVLAARGTPYATAAPEHRAILAAVAAGEPQAAVAALRRHLHQAVENSLAAVVLYEKLVAEAG